MDDKVRRNIEKARQQGESGAAQSPMMDKTNVLPELDGPGPRSSGMEPEPCYCQSQGRYATECLRWDECTQREHGNDPIDTRLSWTGPEPPHLYNRILDSVRSLFVVRDPDGPDPVCSSQEEKIFCARYAGRCAFTASGFGDMFIAAHKEGSSEVLSIDDVVAMKRACARCGDDIRRDMSVTLHWPPRIRPPDPPVYLHINDGTYATFSGQVAGPRCKRPSMDACVDCGGETCAPGCPTRLPDDA